jgi:hypothetical protein
VRCREPARIDACVFAGKPSIDVAKIEALKASGLGRPP